MKSWARAEPMGPWAEPWFKKKMRAAPGPGPGPARNFFFGPGLSPWAHGSMGSARAHDFIIISYILICMYIFPYIFARNPLRNLLGNLLGNPLGNPLGNTTGWGWGGINTYYERLGHTTNNWDILRTEFGNKGLRRSTNNSD